MELAVRWALGLGMAALASLLSATGFIMQRKSHLRKLEDLSHRRLMVLGIIIYVSAAAPDVVSYALIPEVVCSTVQCLRLVVVTALAQTVLQERVERREAVGMALCTAGTLLCVFFGPRPRKVPFADATRICVYSSVCLVALLCLLVLDRKRVQGWRFKGRVAQKAHYIVLPVAAGLAYGLEKIFNTAMGFVRPPDGLPWGIFLDPSWTLLVAAVGLLGLLDLYLNVRGAKQMPVQIFASSSFALSTALQYFQSVVIFKEFEHMSAGHAVLSVLGALVSLAGALCVKPREAGEPQAQGELELMA